ncbi:MAG: UDP-N-acetylmuramate dehydrogenase [Planctomycetaceae bacterium]|jgi:UDP-N-acetylmuramate dehydrogenase|nr:UDP-N-acetylmuramate dehydrogenase [Planctomycetaceae bacterium]
MKEISSESFIRSNVRLADYTRLKIGGTAEYFAEPESEADLLGLLRLCRERNIPIHVIGAGSNILVPELGISGVVISLSHPCFCQIDTKASASEPLVTAGAGAKLVNLITQSVTDGLGGIENLVGIPGTIGGALHDNAGTNNDNIGQWVENVRVANLNGTTSILSKNEISFGYRSSSLDTGVIISATFRLEPESPTELSKRMQKFWIVRKSQLPSNESKTILAFNSTKSGTPASDLIEQANLKGTRIGNAMICEQNANFIVIEPIENDTEKGKINDNANDIKRLIQLVQDRILEKTDIEIESALRIW